jgi:Protein of unknown function (DUF3485)
MRSYLIPSIVVVLLLVLQMFPYRKMTWQTREASPEQQEFSRRLAKVPFEFGDWQSEPADVNQRELEASAATGSYARVFHNRFDPEKKVEIFIVCGHPQDVTIHTPERCYKASGFKEDDEARKFPIDFGKEYGKDVAFFWTNRYKAGSEAEGQQSLRIFWSFSDDGQWVAPNFARLTLGRSPAVYKIYAIAPLKPGEREQPEDSPGKDILHDFLPVLNSVLFPPEKPEATPSAEKATDKAEAPGESSKEMETGASPKATSEGSSAP